MSFRHLLYVGHFEHEGDFIQFSNTPDDPILRPVVRRPIDLGEVRRIAHQVGANGTTQSILPDEWACWVEDGYMACDRYALGPDAIDFILRLVRSTECELVDFNARSAIRAEELTFIEGMQTASSVPGVLPKNE